MLRTVNQKHLSEWALVWKSSTVSSAVASVFPGYPGTRVRTSDPGPTTGTRVPGSGRRTRFRRRVPGSGRGPGSIHETGSNSGRHGLCSRSSRHRSISTSAVTAAAAVALTITILHHCRRRSHRSVANTASAVCF